jgi:hypothetical protein
LKFNDQNASKQYLLSNPIKNPQKFEKSRHAPPMRLPQWYVHPSIPVVVPDARREQPETSRDDFISSTTNSD